MKHTSAGKRENKMGAAGFYEDLFASQSEAANAAGKRWAYGTAGTIARQAQVFTHLTPITSATAELVGSNEAVGVVVDARNRPEGVVRPSDLFRVMLQHAAHSVPQLGLEEAISTPLVARHDEPTWLLASRCAAQNAESAIVVDDDGELIGMCRASDLLGELSDPAIAQCAPSSERPEVPGAGQAFPFARQPVLQFMATAETASYDEPLSTLTARVCRAQSHVVFVVDDHQRPVGLVTPTNVLQSAAAHRHNSLATLTAAEVNLTRAECVDCMQSVEDAANLFAMLGVHWLAVCDAGALVGALSAEQVLRLAVASMPAG